ncbi:MAG: hypothetical protein R3254_08875 [Thiomicrorhabdus sp.]|nr:hypothetical protein [Thiomicrorhabdus sp.]
MSKWIDVKDKLPPVFDNKYGMVHSKRYPVKVKGRGGWAVGYFNKVNDHEFWIIEWFQGDYEVSHWYDLEVIENV